MKAYATPEAFRRALEDRLNASHQQSGLPLDRLRKQAASQRLLARFVQAAPPESWALKGGLAMIAWIGPAARATRDADTTWRLSAETLIDTIASVVEVELDDYFVFEVAEPEEITAEGPEGGLRFRIVARIAGREFETFRLDANIVPNDPRPTTTARLHNAFDFAELPDVTVPVIPIAQQLAEKLHAYTRLYGLEQSDRARDLYDMLTLAQTVELPSAGEVVSACKQTFELRATTWPPAIKPPPSSWEPAWSGSTGFVAVYDAPWVTLDRAYEALTGFFGPLAAGSTSADATWDAQVWEWKP